MATDIRWKSPTVPLANLLTTTLDSLAVDTIDVGTTAINNETNLNTFMDIGITLASLDLSAQVNPSVTVYMLESIDGGTTFDTSTDAVSADASMPPADNIVAVLSLRPGTGAEAKFKARTIIPIPPGRFKLAVRNTTGVIFAASGNVLAYRTYSLQNV